MARHSLTKKQKEQALRAIAAHGNNITEAAKSLGMARNTLAHRLRAVGWKRTEAMIDAADPTSENTTADGHITIPVLPEENLSPDELVERMTDSFNRKKENHEARRWIPLKVNSNAPMGLAWLGDPHVDDDGCDWPTLRRHVKCIQETEGLHGCSIGDVSNNWVGRLAALYANQSATAKEAWKLVEWLIKEIDPLILIAGNHDMWSGAGDPVNWMKKPHTVYEDWSARIQLNFPNGTNTRLIAAHDMAGHSMWNQLHGPMKQAKFLQNADFYIAGHKHTWALSQIELPEADRTPWLARARGYKFFDDYAVKLSLEEQHYGHSIAMIIDPNEDSPVRRVTCFADLEEGADYLTYKRKKYGA